jgi:hypothetical protein
MKSGIVLYLSIALMVAGFTNSLNENYCAKGPHQCNSFAMEIMMGFLWPLTLPMEMIAITDNSDGWRWKFGKTND